MALSALIMACCNLKSIWWLIGSQLAYNKKWSFFKKMLMVFSFLSSRDAEKLKTPLYFSYQDTSRHVSGDLKKSILKFDHRVRFHQIQVRGYDTKFWKIWLMGYLIAEMSHPIWHHGGKIFQDIVSYTETWIWWNQTQVRTFDPDTLCPDFATLPKMHKLFRAAVRNMACKTWIISVGQTAVSRAKKS